MTPLEQHLTALGYTVDLTDAERFNRYRFVLYEDDKSIGRGTYFTGTHRIQPWIELQPIIAFVPENAEHQRLFNALTMVLAPGSHLMVHYLQDTDTAKAITVNVPSPATPIGYLMWQAGVRWYKDWYFTEGWMEGDQKLQGNLPADAATRWQREQEWRTVLDAFVADDSDHPECVDRAHSLLASLQSH